ncbi:MAG: hypothetical protein RR240_04180 [Burkholderiaceae bacterium]
MKRILFALLLAAVGHGGPAPVMAAEQECRTGFRFEPGGHPALDVVLYRPAQAGANAPVVLVLHGLGRNARKMCENWKAYADRSGSIVVAPRFDTPAYAKGLYHLGGITAGSNATLSQSSYALIELLFDEVLRRERLTARTYRLFGHSAGAQVVHRALLLGAVPRASELVAANAGWYTLPLRIQSWPYGLGGLRGREGPELALDAECRAFARDLTVLLGEADQDPAHPSLNRSPLAMAQGPHRLARGKNFYAVAAQRSQALDCALHWKQARVPGVGHQSEGMSRAAAAGFEAALP